MAQNQRKTLGSLVLWTFLFLVAVLLLGSMCRCGARTPSGSERSGSTTEHATINAKDEYGDPLPGGVVNVWDDYETRGRVVARCKDGERVTVLRRSGNGVQIRTSGGATGWVSEWFLR